MREPLTVEIILHVLRDLHAAFPGTKMTDDQVRRRAEVYRDHLEGVSGTALRWAAKASIQEDQYFPKVARLRELATRWTTANAAQVVDIHRNERTCRGCHEPWTPEKRFRPKVDRAGPMTSPDGKWLMLEPYSRDTCKCHPRCEYWPDITAPTSEPAMAIHRSDGSVNIPFATFRLIPPRAPQIQIPATSGQHTTAAA